ncbi:MAG TPA: LacI family DNA-binding transcriptional regulator [Candidatus Mediterraneibacter surreyensis]|nr:LacI family DNA-binding transcriptional regulator [Candidatus Mediterraneibacter surreyensis]
MTIKEIARLANVSSAAVSRYLNGGYISEEKRAQIKKVIEETGYHPSAQARTLRTKRASLVGVVVPKINSESISRVTEGIGNVLAARGYQMLLASTDNNAKKEIEYLHLFEKYPVDGIILIGTMITAEHRRFLKNAQIPVVVTGQNTKYANCVYHDDYGAGKAMGKLAASLSGKHKHIAYIGVTREDKAAGAAREDGFRAGLKSEGRELEEEYVRISAFRAESGYEAALSLLDEETDIGVISCATDTIAAGAIRALRDRGIRLAQDRSVLPQARLVLPDADASADSCRIAVTGFGDNQLLKAATGGIPTVHFGYKTSGIRSAELLLDVIERGEKIPVEMKLGFRLVRGSEGRM